MNDDIKHALASFFAERSEQLERVALHARDLSGAPVYDTDTTAQFLHGFATLVREALSGPSTDARDLFTAAAVEVVVAEGRSAGALASQMVTFAGLIAGELAADVGPEVRADAVAWLAAFLGGWTEELLDAREAAAT